MEQIVKQPTENEESLIDLAQQGDENAVEAIIRAYMGFIRQKSYLYFLAGGDADDVIQEGMIGLCKAIKNYRKEEGAGFRTYAEKCINNQIVSAVRKASSGKAIPLNQSVSIDIDYQDEDGNSSILEKLLIGRSENPEELLILKEKMEKLECREKSFFSPMESRVLVEFLQGKDCREIGELMGKSAKAVDNALQRIRKKLEEHLKEN